MGPKNARKYLDLHMQQNIKKKPSHIKKIVSTNKVLSKKLNKTVY